MIFYPHIEFLQIARVTVDELRKRQARLPTALAFHLTPRRARHPASSFTEMILIGDDLIDLLIHWTTGAGPSSIDRAGPHIAGFIEAGGGDALIAAFAASLAAGPCAMERTMVRNAWVEVARAVISALEYEVENPAPDTACRASA